MKYYRFQAITLVMCLVGNAACNKGPSLPQNPATALTEPATAAASRQLQPPTLDPQALPPAPGFPTNAEWAFLASPARGAATQLAKLEVRCNGKLVAPTPLGLGFFPNRQALLPPNSLPGDTVTDAMLFHRLPLDEKVEMLIARLHGTFFGGTADAIVVGLPYVRANGETFRPVFLAAAYTGPGGVPAAISSWLAQLKPGGPPEVLVGFRLDAPMGRRQVFEANAWDGRRFAPLPTVPDSAKTMRKFLTLTEL